MRLAPHAVGATGRGGRETEHACRSGTCRSSLTPDPEDSTVRGRCETKRADGAVGRRGRFTPDTDASAKETFANHAPAAARGSAGHAYAKAARAGQAEHTLAAESE